MGASDDYLPVRAEQICHAYDASDAGLLRGVPWLATNLNIFHKIRRLDESVIAAADIAARLSLVAYATGNDVDPVGILPGTAEYEPGTVMTMPRGWQTNQIDAKHPNENLGDFRRSQYGDAGRACGMPVNMVTGDSSKHNFASARFDGVSLEEEVGVVRKMLEVRVLRKVVGWWMLEAVSEGVIPPPPERGYRIEWLWPWKDRHTDPAKAANADATRLGNGTLTLADYAAKNGRDPEKYIDKLQREVEEFRRRGLRHPMDAEAAATPAPTPTPAPEDPDDDEETDA